MKSAVEAYKVAEQWTFRDYDQMVFHGFYRSISAWLALLVTGATLYGGIAAVRHSWPPGSEDLRRYVILGMIWVILPCVALLREAIRVRRLSRTRTIAESDVRNHREAVSTHLLSVVCSCGAFNCALQVVWAGLLRH